MPSTDTTKQAIPSTMRAIVLNEPNPQLALTDTVIAVPSCSDNELLVKVEYVGLNPTDGHFAKLGFCHWQYPHILGLDAVGIVVQAKKGVFPGVGTRVMWHASLGSKGALSEYTCVPNFAVSVVPDNLSPSTAAVLPCAGMAALVALDKLELKEGETMFIDGGSGAVGQFAIQFAKQRGVDVFVSASKRNHKLVKSLGADAVFDYHDSNMAKKITRELGPQGFDAVLDTVGGEATVRNIELMRFCGRIACLNALPHLDSELMFRKSPTLCIVSLSGAWLANSLCAQQKLSFMGNLLLEGAASGELKHPKIIEVNFTAEAVSAALETQLAGGFTGKQVVNIGKP